MVDASRWRVVVLVSVSLLIGIGRFTVPGHGLSWPGSYEALAHLWVGGLLGAWWNRHDAKLLWAVGLLSLLEVIMAVFRVL